MCSDISALLELREVSSLQSFVSILNLLNNEEHVLGGGDDNSELLGLGKACEV